MRTATRILSAMVIPLVLAACSGPSSSPSPDAPAPTATAQVTVQPTELPSPTVSPVAPSPSAQPTPTTAATEPELVIRSVTCSDTCPPQPGTTVLSDGRVIWTETGPGGRRLVQRTLTAPALASVRDAIAATRALGSDGRYFPTLRPGKEAPGHGVIHHGFRAMSDDGIVRVEARDPVTYEADNELYGRIWRIPEEAYALSDLADKLADPVAWLTDAGFGDALAPYEPDTYALIVTTEPGRDLPQEPDITEVAWPFPRNIESFGRRYRVNGSRVENSRCQPITGVAAHDLIAAERRLGNQPDPSAPFIDYSHAWRRGPGAVHLRLIQLLPDQDRPCLEGGAW